MTDEQLSKPLGEAERSFHECLVHLLNTEARFPEVILLALSADEPLFVDIHAERQLGKLLRYEQQPFKDLLVYFRLRRQFVLPLFESLKDEQWGRTIREQGKQRRESVYWRARGQALHELDHVEDLEGKLGVLYF